MTKIKDNKTEIQENAIKDVEMNLWSSDWADGIEMYNMGYKLINTIDDYGYMVPNGNLGRANPYYQEEKIGSSYAEYTLNGNLKDSSQNQRNLTAGENAEVKDGALQLKEGKSYVTSPLEQLGNGNALSFDITLENEAKPGEILFEEDAPYGTHDIRIMEDGNLGFTRELYEYKFDYKILAGKKVNLRIAVTQQKAELFVNGEFISAATGRFFHNDMVKKDRITNATFALPLERIGSKTKAIAAKIDNVRITSADMYNKAAWTGQTNSETPNLGSEGQLWQAFDNNAGTRWHSDWKGTTGTVENVNGTPGTLEEIWAEITFDQPYEINQFSFTPRTDTASGYVTKASLMVKNTADGQWKEIAANQVFENNGKRKVFDFELQEVAAVKFIAKQSSDGWVAVTEFDIARTGEPGETPDPENPDPEKPDPENPDPENPDPENPNPDKPNPDQPNPDQPGGDSNGGNKPDGNKPSGNTSTTNKPVKTGDSFQMTWIVLGIISGTVIVALKKKRKRNV